MNFLKSINIVIGPTASGKSKLALEMAENAGGVIINADSQQMYRDLPILTARPTPEEEARAAHRLYGMLPSHEHCSAGKWLTWAKMEIDWTLAQGKTPIVVGGTGLYLKALMQGIAEIPAVDPSVRAQSISDYEAMGKEPFAGRLREVDPGFFVRLKVYDRQRLIRAWEVWLGTGKPLSYWQSQGAAPPYPPEYFEVTKVELPREELYRRCDERFVKMIEAGAVEEVRRCFAADAGCRMSDTGREMPLTSGIRHPASGVLRHIIGVSQILAYLNKEMTLDEAVAQAQQATRNYAKRQMTWFKRQLP